MVANVLVQSLEAPPPKPRIPLRLSLQVPDLVVLAALGEQVHTTRFNRFGSVPWLLRVPKDEVSLAAQLGEGSFGQVYAAAWRGTVASSPLQLDT